MESAPDAEALMRSRYTAYTLDNHDYLQKTWDSRSRPEATHFENRKRCKWLGLQVLSHQPAGQKATVEFIANYKIDGRAVQLHEISRFEFKDRQWFYVDGAFPDGV
jgi:SEC-C motif-containing protein